MQTRVQFAALGRRWSWLKVISHGWHPSAYGLGPSFPRSTVHDPFGLVRRTWRSLTDRFQLSTSNVLLRFSKTLYIQGPLFCSLTQEAISAPLKPRRPRVKNLTTFYALLKLGMCTDVIEPARTWHVKFGHVRTVRTARTVRTGSNAGNYKNHAPRVRAVVRRSKQT